MTRSTRTGDIVPITVLAVLASFLITTLPAAAHGGHATEHGAGATPWTRWAALAALVVGVGLVGAGIVVDWRSDGRNPRSDALVVTGTVLALLSMAVFWL